MSIIKTEVITFTENNIEALLLSTDSSQMSDKCYMKSRSVQSQCCVKVSCLLPIIDLKPKNPLLFNLRSHILGFVGREGKKESLINFFPLRSD